MFITFYWEKDNQTLGGKKTEKDIKTMEQNKDNQREGVLNIQGRSSTSQDKRFTIRSEGNKKDVDEQ